MHNFCSNNFQCTTTTLSTQHYHWTHFEHWTTAAITHLKKTFINKSKILMVTETCATFPVQLISHLVPASSSSRQSGRCHVKGAPLNFFALPTTFVSCPTKRCSVPHSSAESPAFMSSLLKWFVQVHLRRGTTHSGETFLWRELFQAITNTYFTRQFV